MRIDGLPQHPGVERPSQRSTSARVPKDRSPAADSVEISASVLSVGELNAQAKAAQLESDGRIAEIQSKVRSGYYDSRQVREEIADRLLDSDGMQRAVGDISQARVAKDAVNRIADVRPERVEQARQRASEGFYESGAVRRDIAQRILDELM